MIMKTLSGPHPSRAMRGARAMEGSSQCLTLCRFAWVHLMRICANCSCLLDMYLIEVV